MSLQRRPSTSSYLCLALLAALAMAGAAGAQTPWVKHADNPVLQTGPPGAWDSVALWGPDLYFDGTGYHLWYSGEAEDGIVQVGYATSPDGVTWTKHPDNPILTVGEAGEWDDTIVFAGSVVSDGATFHMWYSGGQTAGTVEGAGLVGYASSPDGVTWTRHPDNPVLSPAPDGWDNQGVVPGTVLFDGETYRMWYTSGRGSLPTPSWWRIGYAESTDGVTWTTQALPVLIDGAGAAWDGWLVYEPGVVFDGLTYHMWYSAYDNDARAAIGYATSPDGRHWSKHAGNPVLRPGSAGDWDGQIVEAPRVMLDGDVAKMWYKGSPDAAGPYQIGYATADPALPTPPMHLNGGRFSVDLAWEDLEGNIGVAEPVKLTGDAGYFWFFDAANVEVTVKVLDACAISDRFWVFAAGMTNVGVTMTVTDTVTWIERTYANPVGEPFEAVLDTDAFETCAFGR